MTYWTEAAISAALSSKNKDNTQAPEPVQRDFIRVASSQLSHFKTERLQQIVNAVAQQTGLNAKNIIGKSRMTRHTRARHIVTYVLREVTDYSFPVIGALMKRDHTTCLHSWQRVSANPESFEPDLSAVLSLFQAREET